MCSKYVCINSGLFECFGGGIGSCRAAVEAKILVFIGLDDLTKRVVVQQPVVLA